MQFVQQLIQKYDPATVFVSAATVVVCVELDPYAGALAVHRCALGRAARLCLAHPDADPHAVLQVAHGPHTLAVEFEPITARCSAV